MFDIIYAVISVVTFPVWFILASLMFRHMDEDSYTSVPMGLNMMLSFLVAIVGSLAWFVTIPLVILILLGRCLVKPYGVAVEVLYKVLFNKE